MQRLLFCAAALLALGMSACTTTSPGARTLRADRAEVDYDQVAVVNELSLRRGVDVTWINPPVKRVPAKSGLAN